MQSTDTLVSFAPSEAPTQVSSTTTLAPLIRRDGSITLGFLTHDLRNTVLTPEGGNYSNAIYTVITDDDDKRTVVYRGQEESQEEIASLQRYGLRPDQITLGRNEKPTKLSGWLKGEGLKSSIGMSVQILPVSFVNEFHNKFTWKKDQGTLMALYPSNENIPIAYYQPPRKRFVDGKSSIELPFITLSPNFPFQDNRSSSLTLRDLLLVSIVEIERKRREKEIGVQSAGIRAMGTRMEAIG
ncbi:hypothetical protein BD410DRAFT_790158 [Rickenella mellea]|uniref:DUF6593 domain-containing protein n=1 Tax=Rickenella mellea TaxID=50990 RepID=A0A4Y7Q0B8_9AGAM|nr:hypothetical protein BD410DRAFT_790158 [Rickenella mellea]